MRLWREGFVLEYPFRCGGLFSHPPLLAKAGEFSQRAAAGSLQLSARSPFSWMSTASTRWTTAKSPRASSVPWRHHKPWKMWILTPSEILELLGLGGILKRSEKMLVLWDKTYIENLGERGEGWVIRFISEDIIDLGFNIQHLWAPGIKLAMTVSPHPWGFGILDRSWLTESVLWLWLLVVGSLNVF